MNNITRAISIRQPYIELILLGKKSKEYRSKPTKIREIVYLYSSLKFADDPYSFKELNIKPEDLPRGCIVGTVEIVDCIWDSENGCYAYVLKNPKRLKNNLYAKNKPQPVFWKPIF